MVNQWLGRVAEEAPSLFGLLPYCLRAEPRFRILAALIAVRCLATLNLAPHVCVLAFRVLPGWKYHAVVHRHLLRHIQPGDPEAHMLMYVWNEGCWAGLQVVGLAPANRYSCCLEASRPKVPDVVTPCLPVHVLLRALACQCRVWVVCCSCDTVAYTDFNGSTCTSRTRSCILLLTVHLSLCSMGNMHVGDPHCA